MIEQPGTTIEQEAPDGTAGLPWHASAGEAVLQRLQARTEGLTAPESEARLRQYGPNGLPRAERPSALRRLLRQFQNLLIYVLLFSAGLSLLLGHFVDAGVILAVVIANAVIGFLQEGRAEEALDAIRNMIDPEAAVRRDGQRLRIAAERIVPGDIVLLEAGDRVPADLRLLRANHLKIDEAVLTGESLAVEKAADPVAPDAALGDRTSMAFSGTLVVAGQGVGVAIATGPRTELGGISRLVRSVATLDTPLLRQMAGFARQLTLAILALSLVTLLVAWLLRDYTVADALMTVIGLAVAAIPEGLPAIMTITLAIGVRRMAGRHAIIRRLPAVETLGAVSVICTDKTGTLTCNEMTVHSIVTGRERYDVTGAGYDPAGDIVAGGRLVDAAADGALRDLLRAGLLCNDAMLRNVDGAWRVDGDPMEGALVVLAAKAGFDADESRKATPRLDEIPFDAGHRFMASLHHSHDDGEFIVVKGAPERILRMCAAERGADGVAPLRERFWRQQVDALAADGQRTLAFAMKAAPTGQNTLRFDEVETGLVLLGIAGFIDPPREEAKAAVASCHAAGIRVIMITGDHALTAGAIARQLGLAEQPTVMTGEQLDGLDGTRLRAAARATDVFARTTPEHKLRLVEALQADERIIAMTGDGVNDAPALKRADVGIAMGRKGTEAAKEAAEMVLADDNFASIVHAVREGRTVYDNLTKVIAWTLPTNAGEALIILAAVCLGLALPITPVQILWVNLVTAVTLGLTLAFEPTEAATMRRRPRPAHQPLLGADLLWRVGFVAILFVLAAFGMYYWALERGADVASARTMVVNTVVVLEVFYLFSVRYVRGTSLTWQGVLGTPAVLAGVGAVAAAQALFTYAPFMQRVFDSRPLGMSESAAIAGAGVAMLLVVEVEKYCRRRLAARG